MTRPPRARRAHSSGGNHRARRARGHGAAPLMAAAGALLIRLAARYGASHPQTVRRPRALPDRLPAAASADRREPVVERRDALDRLTVGMLTDPLVSRVAARPDRQGIGGAAAGETLGDRRFFSPCA
ncbi:hypothetical protein [Streptomyces sp. NPDC001652]|uniref:hypothetical protein n=1 Tax=Streptomyces sp. NPDC001652 TaxID=3154393 RepID=UPI003317F5D1